MNNQPRHYQLRPTTVMAMQFSGTIASTEAIFQWLGEHGVKCFASKDGGQAAIMIPRQKSAGTQIVRPKDYIVKDQFNEFLVCNPPVFDLMFRLTAWEENRESDMWPEEAEVTDGQEAICRLCGCTENAACEGGCSWASEEQIRAAGLEPMDGDICSRCVAPPITPERPSLKELYDRLPHDTRIHKVIADGETYHWVDIYVGDRSVVCEVKTDPVEAMQAVLDKWGELHKQKNEQ